MIALEPRILRCHKPHANTIKPPRENPMNVSILGYPVYFLTLLGVWKVLGAIALLVPGLPRLKEWAYAGIVFNMTGAAASHAFSTDYGAYGFHLIVTLFLAALAVTSLLLLPHSRPRSSLLGIHTTPSRALV